jgi:hypothetical protein
MSEKIMIKIKNNLIFASLALLLFGCVPITEVVETISLRQAEVNGPIMPAPVHLTDSTEIPYITVSPRISYNTKNQLKGEIKNISGYYALDTIFIPSDNSLVWNMPKINAGIDIDLGVSRNFSLTFGLNYFSDNTNSAWGGNFGLSLFSYEENTAIRFDGGVQIHSMHYDAFSFVHIRTTTTNFWGDVTKVEEYNGFYHDVGTTTRLDPYLNFTFNTAFKYWPINFFINTGYSVQTLFSFTPQTSYYYTGLTKYIKTDIRGESTAGFINVTPGIFVYINNSTRVLMGVRYYFEQNIDRSDPKIFVLPMVQFDFTF